MSQEFINNLPKGTILHGKSFDYEITKVLGQGSFGITYLATVRMRGELGIIEAKAQVAIKEFFMHEVNGRDNSTVTSGSDTGVYDKYKRKFIGEAKSLGKLKHENIVNVLEEFEANNTVYYIMEYINGGSLDNYIAEKEHLSEKEMMEIAPQIASALSYMHSQNMVHLDLKPSNVMFKDKSKAILIDFGLSKQFNDDGEPESSTTIGGGTPGYAPLEQATYHSGAGGKLPVYMDVYAFGGTLFKMLTGKRPPVASDLLNEGFPEEELQKLNVSGHTIQCLKKAMAPLKSQRYASIHECINDLTGKAQPVVPTPEEDTIVFKTPKQPAVPTPQPKKQEDDSTLLVGTKEESPKKDAAPAKPIIPIETKQPSQPKNAKKLSTKNTRIAILSTIFVGLCVFLFFLFGKSEKEANIETNEEEVTAAAEPKIPDNFVCVPAGRLEHFQPDENYDLWSDVDSFYICKYEVTQKEYTELMGETRCPVKGDNLPVYKITFTEGIKYCNARSKAEGYDGFYTIDGTKITFNPKGNGYRLPSEYEWVWAARGAVNQPRTKYAAGNDLNAIAWYGGNSKDKPHPVGQKQPNTLGLYDMNGNIEESFWDSEGIYEFNGYKGGSYIQYLYFKEGDCTYPDPFIPVGLRLVFIPRDFNHNNISNNLVMKDYQQEKGSTSY